LNVDRSAIYGIILINHKQLKKLIAFYEYSMNNKIYIIYYNEILKAFLIILKRSWVIKEEKRLAIEKEYVVDVVSHIFL
jgi:hypothetical protein